ncbi:hypothetical protein [Streptomyces sp. NPDC002088]|uniref:hypothetical protein n=1 Tax=Streptomyces sp. NPDC002088 TaxID=3154665 RepID=UPI0033177913
MTATILLTPAVEERDPPSAVCLLAPGRDRWDLLVGPPAATDAEARRLMEGMAIASKDSVGW